LVYEGEVEGPVYVAQSLIGKAVREQFLNYFPDPEKTKKRKDAKNPYKKVVDWFGDGNVIDILTDITDREYDARLKTISGLDEVVEAFHPTLSKIDKTFMMEFALHGLAEFSLISKKSLDTGLQFKDLLDSMFNGKDFENEDEQY
jgi:magnesium chelatase subunit I